ncbi:hypothetical protein [Paramagnetospirillum magneticum]|uniref:Uncharacterized protein n=1 Tax=Paramagnetospirillum magneticum (strain ATCC 700264 / AMB-1) TaxID=342108 RepID=Q2W616_PARM1|nr:hypothetical protein [Paramagnetospirillum magneticum]BAE50709.1 hypothetical protein amb1905 [Paramagnetospirillum magneticum AMB-1]
MPIAPAVHALPQAPLQRRTATSETGVGAVAFGDYRYDAAPIQRKTVIQYGKLQDFTFAWGNKTKAERASGEVATSMHAELDPLDPAVGTDTGGSDAFDTLFQALQAHTSTTWVRGHLLNHDLGGRAIYNNLFPITTAANGEHYQEVEKNVKHWVGEGCSVTYDVDAVQSDVGVGNPDGAFVCEAEVTKDPLASGLSGEKIRKVIVSHGTNKASTVRTFENKNDMDVEKYSGVLHGKGNTVMRDAYGSLSKDPAWEHDSGSSGVNNVYITKPKDLGRINYDNWSMGKGKSIAGLDYDYNFSVPQFKKYF